MIIKYAIAPTGVFAASTLLWASVRELNADEPRTNPAYELRWSCATSAGGGQVLSGGVFSASGTPGQPAPGSMSGGIFDSQSGFQGGVPIACTCVADMNDDRRIDSADIRRFVECVMSADPYCACADVNDSSSVDVVDIALFVEDLLTKTLCP